MWGFHVLIYIFGIRNIRDTQCGFKLFSRAAAQSVFPRMHIERWIFDIEILILCGIYEINVTEVQIQWHEVDGTKMDFLADSIQMLSQLIIIRANYYFGFW